MAAPLCISSSTSFMMAGVVLRMCGARAMPALRWRPSGAAVAALRNPCQQRRWNSRWYSSSSHEEQTQITPASATPSLPREVPRPTVALDGPDEELAKTREIAKALSVLWAEPRRSYHRVPRQVLRTGQAQMMLVWA
eukprot:RCo012650